MNKEDAWVELSTCIAKLKVLSNIVEHTSEVEMNQYKKLSHDHDPKSNRYHHGIHFYDIDSNLISSETISFNIEGLINLIIEQENNQYKWILVEAYEAFKKFVKKIYGNGQEINILISHGYTNIFHKNYKKDLFYIVSIIKIMRDEIAHNKNQKNINVDMILQKIQELWVKNSFSEVNFGDLHNSIELFIEADRGIVLTRKEIENNLFLPRLDLLLNCLSSYSYHIKNQI